MKPSKWPFTPDDVLQEQAAAALKDVPNVKVQQCMNFYFSSLKTSPVRVYVETDFCKIPKDIQHRKADMSIEAWKAERHAWKVQSQSKAREAIAAASAVLKDAGFKFKQVEDYGWAQLTITGGPK